MGDLTPHFSAHELRCKDGSERPIDCRLLSMLEAVRCHFDAPVIITSGYRSPSYNARVGGAPDSFHCKGMAADIQVVGLLPRQVYEWVERVFPVSGVGLYVREGGGWVHIDCRSSRARWTG
jgi:uncharacterized protein YcbK (DUF882 family)